MTMSPYGKPFNIIK